MYDALARRRRRRDEPQQEHLADPPRARRRRRRRDVHRDDSTGRLPLRGDGPKRRGGDDARAGLVYRGGGGSLGVERAVARAADPRERTTLSLAADRAHGRGRAGGGSRGRGVHRNAVARPGRGSRTRGAPHDLRSRILESFGPQRPRLGGDGSFRDGPVRAFRRSDLPDPLVRERRAPASRPGARDRGEPFPGDARPATPPFARRRRGGRLLRRGGRPARPRDSDPHRRPRPGRTQRRNAQRDHRNG